MVGIAKESCRAKDEARRKHVIDHGSGFVLSNKYQGAADQYSYLLRGRRLDALSPRAPTLEQLEKAVCHKRAPGPDPLRPLPVRGHGP
jgi:hypothetical protein